MAARTLAATRQTRFLPSDLTPFFWVAADLGLGNLAHGTAIARWNDLSGNSNHAVQATGGAQPSFQETGGPNGRPWVLFDGSADYLATAAFGAAISQPITQIIVGKATANNSHFTDGIASGANRGGILRRATGNWSINGGTLVEDGAADSNWHIFSAVLNGAASSLRIDGVAVLSAVNAGTDTMTGATLGASQGGISSWLAGGLAEVVMVNAALTANQLRWIERYLSIKYAITVTQ